MIGIGQIKPDRKESVKRKFKSLGNLNSIITVLIFIYSIQIGRNMLNRLQGKQ